ncbi:hypothetical protein FB451DRAFT_1562046 [Mycena latifolia]|nr:hypothetical protein FB451DRAFT_1562046 [Mycena latifolia]
MTTQAAKLPLELERRIFELAAQAHPPTIPTLLRVAHRVLVWLEPLLYKVLRLTTPDRTAAVLDAVAAKPIAFLTATVRKVLIFSSTYSIELDAVEAFLASCPEIDNLSLLMSGAGPCLLPLLRLMHIQRLGANLSELFRDEDDEDQDEGDSPVDFEHPVFAAVTHLDVFDELEFDGEYDESMDWLKGLATLPALTHLALNSPVHPDVLQHILAAAPQLQVFLVAFTQLEADTAEAFAQEVTFADPRLVVATHAEYFADWERGARGGEDIWVRVEGFLERKRNGEIDSHQYFFDGGDEESGSDTDEEWYVVRFNSDT